MKYGNLHLHSTHSDAGFRPAHLVTLAKSLGYKALALTDHEAISGLPELFAIAENNQMEAMAGVELYATLRDSALGLGSFHIVGLDFDPTHPAIVKFTDEMTAHRNDHTRRQYEHAVQRGILPDIPWSEIERCNPGSKWFCNDQVYFALDALGAVPLYKRNETYRAAFKTGEAAQIKIYIPDAKDVIEAIREAGGIAVLAHPSERAFPFLPQLIRLGLKGIECCHPDLSERETNLAIHAAVEYGLYASGGTDHTGPMSACGGKLAIPAYQGVTEDEYTAIKERRFGV